MFDNSLTDGYLDARAAARRLNLPLATIYRLIADGQLPALFHPVRIRPEDIDQVPERCRIRPGQLGRSLNHTGTIARARAARRLGSSPADASTGERRTRLAGRRGPKPGSVRTGPGRGASGEEEERRRRATAVTRGGSREGGRQPRRAAPGAARAGRRQAR